MRMTSMSTAEPDVGVRPVTGRPVRRRARDLGLDGRPEHADRVVEDVGVLLHAGSAPSDHPGRRRRIARSQVVAERATVEEQVVAAASLGVGDEVEALGEHRLAGHDLVPADRHVDRALAAHDEPVVPGDRPRGEARLLLGGGTSARSTAGSSS